MSKPKTPTLAKPVLSKGAVLQFAEQNNASRSTSSAAAAPVGAKSGLVPTGDVRLTANIREDLHLKLKIRAAQERTTVGELIERWVDSW
jgi:hypothetical protein